MRRLDRAIFAIFLLALVADVARSYASTPASSELSGSLILNAASQFQGTTPATVNPANRRGSYTPFFTKRTQHHPVLSTWSKAFHPPAQWSQVALLQPSAILAPQSSYRAEPLTYLPSSSLALLEHAGNPAP